VAEFFDAITDKQQTFVEKQPMFFVATAASDGRVNLSPKGYDAFRVLGPNRVAYLDLSGSGNETHAHITANNRITFMFCAFDNPALIYRIYGHGKPVLPQDDGWEELAQNFTILPGTRQIFDIMVDQVQTSCGYGVPHMTLESERPTLVKYHKQTEPEDWLKKVAGRTQSIDGLPTRASERFFSGEESA